LLLYFSLLHNLQFFLQFFFYILITYMIIAIFFLLIILFICYFIIIYYLYNFKLISCLKGFCLTVSWHTTPVTVFNTPITIIILVVNE